MMSMDVEMVHPHHHQHHQQQQEEEEEEDQHQQQGPHQHQSVVNNDVGILQQATVDDLVVRETRSLIPLEETTLSRTESESEEDGLFIGTAAEIATAEAGVTTSTTGTTTTSTSTLLENLRTERTHLLNIWKGFVVCLLLICGLWVHAFATGSLISFVVSTIACVGFNTALERQGGENFDRMWLRLDEIEVQIRSIENGGNTSSNGSSSGKDRQNHGVPYHVQQQWPRFVFQKLLPETNEHDNDNSHSLDEPHEQRDDPTTTTMKDDDADADDLPCCSICLCDFEHNDVIVRLPCGHEFHDDELNCGSGHGPTQYNKNCIQPWIQRHSRCPLCNTDLSQPP